MNLLGAIRISGSGMTAQRLRMDVIANNIANINTTRTPQGGPYRRKIVIFEPLPARFEEALGGYISPLEVGGGVIVVGIQEDASPPRLVYDPGHPDAGPDGYVAMPNVDIIKEMVDMISASRAYEANVAAMSAARTMMLRALDIIR